MVHALVVNCLLSVDTYDATVLLQDGANLWGVTMSTQGKSETIRIRIEPEKKIALTKLYEERGTSLSGAVREFLDQELESQAQVLDRFDTLMGSADRKREAYGAPEPSIEDIVAYVERVREERSKDLVGA